MVEKIFPNDLFFAWVAQKLQQGRPVRFKLNGTSMFPLLRNGKDYVTVSPLKSELQISKYDIVLFEYKGRHILHRIIDMPDSNGEYRLRGDGSYYAEEGCHYSDILGVVTLFYRGESGNAINPNSIGLHLYARLWHSMPGAIRRFALKVLQRLLR